MHFISLSYHQNINNYNFVHFVATTLLLSNIMLYMQMLLLSQNKHQIIDLLFVTEANKTNITIYHCDQNINWSILFVFEN